MKKYLLSAVFGAVIFVDSSFIWAAAYAADNEYQTPGAVAERAGARMADDLRKNASDKERWRSFSLSNQDVDPKSLKILLIKDSGLYMTLDPKKNHLIFENPGLKQVFAIQGPSEEYRNYGDCLKYNIRVIDASSTHVVIAQNCVSQNIAPNKIMASTDYYLYDMKTATMLDLWRSGSELRTLPLSFVRPDPSVKKINNGYRIDLKYRNSLNSSDELNMRNIYHYSTDDTSKKYTLTART